MQDLSQECQHRQAHALLGCHLHQQCSLKMRDPGPIQCLIMFSGTKLAFLRDFFSLRCPQTWKIMENLPFTDDFPIKTSIYGGFSSSSCLTTPTKYPMFWFLKGRPKKTWCRITVELRPPKKMWRNPVGNHVMFKFAIYMICTQRCMCYVHTKWYKWWY